MKKWLFFAIIVLLPFLIAWSREVELTTDDGLTLVGEFLETNSPLAPASFSFILWGSKRRVGTVSSIP